MHYHGSAKCSINLANYFGLLIAPVALFDDVDKDSVHVKLFLLKSCHEGHNSMVLPIVILELKASLLLSVVLIWY